MSSVEEASKTEGDGSGRDKDMEPRCTMPVSFLSKHRLDTKERREDRKGGQEPSPKRFKGGDIDAISSDAYIYSEAEPMDMEQLQLEQQVVEEEVLIEMSGYMAPTDGVRGSEFVSRGLVDEEDASLNRAPAHLPGSALLQGDDVGLTNHGKISKDSGSNVGCESEEEKARMVAAAHPQVEDGGLPSGDGEHEEESAKETDSEDGSEDDDFEDEDEKEARLVKDLGDMGEDMKESFRDQLISLGPERFSRVHDHISPKAWLKLFGFPMHEESAESLPSSSFYGAWISWAYTEVIERKKLEYVKKMHDVIRLLNESKNIIVITGAGISVSCGIPDFRSKNGIYSRLGEFNLSCPQDMFDLAYFRSNPKTFYTFAKEIYPSNFRPSPSHAFISLLEKKGKLLRNFTQNIDTLEDLAGITRKVNCHGCFSTASCLECRKQIPGKDIEKFIFLQEIPYCGCGGVIKPDIVFFGEPLPKLFDELFEEDRKKCDLVIVMGSSLKVAPVADMIHKIPRNVPQILINKEYLTHLSAHFDVSLLGFCDTIVSHLCNLLDWELEHPSHVKKLSESVGEERAIMFAGARLGPFDVSPGAPSIQEQQVKQAMEHFARVTQSDDEDSEEDSDFKAKHTDSDEDSQTVEPT